MLVADAGKEETIVVARLDLERLRGIRSKGIWGDAFRRPTLYAQLTHDAQPVAFVRQRARGSR